MNPWHCFVSFISKSARQHAGLHAWLCSHTTHRTMCSCALFWRGRKLLALLGVLYSRYRNSPTDVGDDGSWNHPIQAYFCVSLPPTQPINQAKVFVTILVYHTCSTIISVGRTARLLEVNTKQSVQMGRGGGKGRSWIEMWRDSIQGTSFHYLSK